MPFFSSSQYFDIYTNFIYKEIDIRKEMQIKKKIFPIKIMISTDHLTNVTDKTSWIIEKKNEVWSENK